MPRLPYFLPAMSSLTRSTMMLTLSGLVEFTVQFFIPVIFVRNLDATTFGEYRLLWLVAGTALALAPAFMPQSLFYFLPRANQERQLIYIGNVLAYLAVAGCMTALITCKANPFLPNNLAHLFVNSKGLSSLFLGSWVVVSLMMVLPVAEGRVSWQAGSDLALSLLRTTLLAGAAIMTHQLVWVIAALMADVGARVSMMIFFLYTRPGGGGVSVRFSALKEQLQYALPFAAGNALFQLRGVAGQWIVASMLSPAWFGLFSISSIFLSITALIRQPVSTALLPRLNKTFSEGQFHEFVRLFRKSGSATTLILMALGGFLICVTRELVEIIYTGRYAEAVPVMRIYLVSMMMQGCAAGYVLPVLNRVRVSVINNACCLVISIVCSYFGTSYWGVLGTACGSVIAFLIGELWSLGIVARVLGVRIRDLLPWRSVVSAGSASSAGLAIVAVASSTVTGPALLQMLIKGVLFLGTFSAVFVALGGWAQLEILRLTSVLTYSGEGRARP